MSLGGAAYAAGAAVVLLAAGTALPLGALPTPSHGFWTHGFDGLAHLAGPAPLATALGTFDGVTPRPPTCVASGTWDFHGRVVYARPSDKPDRYNQLLPTIRAAFNLVNGKLRQEAELLGVVASYKMRCSAPGTVEVARVTLPTPSGQADFHTIVDDLEALGYASPVTKYWVVYETGSSTYGGQANLRSDDRLVADNLNNAGPSYAVTFGCAAGQQALCGLVMMHESAHNIGAVQDSAPHSTGAGHCNDEWDLLCYDDGGPEADPRVVCAGREYFDCGHDDYFHPSPGASSYLAGHWNLGSPLNRFVRFPALTDRPGAPREVLALPGFAVENGLLRQESPVLLSWSAPADAGDAPVTNYRVYRALGSGPFALVGQVGDARGFEDAGFPETGAYTYQVRALSNAGEGAGANVTVAAVRWT